MKRMLATLFFASTLATASIAVTDDGWARSGEISSSLFLGYNETQQSVYVKQMIEGESSMVAKCAPDQSTDQLTEALVAYMRTNPRYMQRSANLAFTEMLMEKCKARQ